MTLWKITSTISNIVNVCLIAFHFQHLPNRVIINSVLLSIYIFTPLFVLLQNYRVIYICYWGLLWHALIWKVKRVSFIVSLQWHSKQFHNVIVFEEKSFAMFQWYYTILKTFKSRRCSARSWRCKGCQGDALQDV